MLAARHAVLELIGALRSRYQPDAVAMVGFSQGAMLALDAGLQPESGVSRVAALSGTLLAATRCRRYSTRVPARSGF